MIYKLSVEERETLEILREDIKRLSNHFYVLLINLVADFKKATLMYIYSFKEFNRSNLKASGFINVLTNRAYRFFSIEEKEIAEGNEKSVRLKIRAKKYFKRLLKIALFPFFLVLLSLSIFIKSKKNNKKNVINDYRV